MTQGHHSTRPQRLYRVFDLRKIASYHSRQLWVEACRCGSLQRKGKIVCVIRWVSEIKYFTGPLTYQVSKVHSILAGGNAYISIRHFQVICFVKHFISFSPRKVGEDFINPWHFSQNQRIFDAFSYVIYHMNYILSVTLDKVTMNSLLSTVIFSLV